jgi:hypothetical protein
MLIALLIILAILSFIVFLSVILWENVIFPILGVVAILVIFFGEHITVMFKKPIQPIVNVSQDNCVQFILEVMTEMYSRIYILKPFGIENLHFKIKQQAPFFCFVFSATMAGDSVFDDVSIAEIKYIIQERITERLYYGNANGIPYSIHGDCVSLVITDVKVAGNRYNYECVWVNNQAALDYVISRNNNGGDSVSQIPPNDDTF